MPSALQARSADRQRTALSRRPIAIGCALLAILLGILGGVLDRSTPLSFGHDLIPSYCAGRTIWEGHADRLYDAAASQDIARRVMADANLSGDPARARWLNPAFFTPVFIVLSAAPYRWAMLIWMGVNAALFGATMVTLAGWLPPRRRLRLAFVVIVLTSCPLLLAAEHQQNTFLSLAIITAGVTAWRSKNALRAGLLIGLLAYKPQLAAVVGLVLAIHLGRRALLGLAISGLGLLVLGELLARGSTAQFLFAVPKVVALIQSEPAFNWGRQMTPTSFIRALLGPDGNAARIGALISMAAAGALVWLAARTRLLADDYFADSVAPASIDRGTSSGDASALPLIAATITGLSLCAPYFMDYDLLLLAIPMALVLAVTPRRAIWLPLAAIWVAIYLNSDFVQATHVNIAVIALAAAFIGLVWPKSSVPTFGRRRLTWGGLRSGPKNGPAVATKGSHAAIRSTAGTSHHPALADS